MLINLDCLLFQWLKEGIFFSGRVIPYYFVLLQRRHYNKQTYRLTVPRVLYILLLKLTEEYHASLQQVKDAGITILHEHTWKNNILSFYFHDPDNNLVEVIEERGLWD